MDVFNDIGETGYPTNIDPDYTYLSKIRFSGYGISFNKREWKLNIKSLIEWNCFNWQK